MLASAYEGDRQSSITQRSAGKFGENRTLFSRKFWCNLKYYHESEYFLITLAIKKFQESKISLTVG